MNVSLMKDENGIEFYTIPHLKELQLLMLDLLIIVDKIARENNIQYWIDGGTLLGAVRHKGFIPWDDDLDICLLKKDFDKLLPLLHNYTKDSNDLSLMYFRNERHQYWLDYFTSDKIRIEYNGMQRLARIDIIPMKLIKNEASEIKEDKYITDLLNWFTKGKTKYFPEIRNLYKFKTKKDAIKDKKAFLEKFDDDYLRKNFEINDKTNLLVDYAYGSSYVPGDREYKKYTDIFPLTEIEFEGYKFFCPNNIDKYLTVLYRDYMKLPQLKDRKPGHNSKINVDGSAITEDEIEVLLDEQYHYFFYANKMSYKFYVLFRQIKSNGFANAFSEIIKPFIMRKLNK
jgi:lipopolysaccharide cholinephosphotransferase